MIRRLQVAGLHGKHDLEINFHPDLNIITGRNGSGKTTVLKLLWYLISANLERIAPEIALTAARVETDTGLISYESSTKLIEIIVGKQVFKIERPEDPEEDFDIINGQVMSLSQKSIFFPTFRRIEGGFSMKRADRLRGWRTIDEMKFDIDGALQALSNSLSVRGHRFVSSLSTNDIGELLQVEYAKLSEISTRAQKQLSEEIIREISDYNIASGESQIQSIQDAESVLTSIQSRVEQVSQETAKLVRPFEVLGATVGRILRYKGIVFDQTTSIGDVSSALQSDALSAGEKQMLSFLSYNIFNSNATIFIDEPEISLHIDWQRILFPTLLQQGTTNQFIIATHSPFMYSKFPDREIPISSDRGGAL